MYQKTKCKFEFAICLPFCLILTNINICRGMCLPGTLDPKKVKGKIVLCFRGLNSRVNKGYDVSKAGGIGMILANTINGESDLMADPHFLPATHISAADGQSVYAYIKSTKYTSLLN